MGVSSIAELTVYEQIKEAGCDLFRSQGFKETLLTDLVEMLQTRELDFYRYFNSMDELLAVIWSE